MADFERSWLDQFGRCVQETLGDEARRVILQGSEHLSDASERQAVAAWSAAAMQRLEALAGADRGRRVLTGCACQYPRADLQPIRAAYQAGGEIAVAHRMLQERFETFLRQQLELEEERVQWIVQQGWGLAGILEGGRIVATKIPKSSSLRQYLSEGDPEQRRRLYCHCPRIRAVLNQAGAISPLYCYCGAGFYRGIWEEILQRPVEVEVLESVLAGGAVCRIAVRW